jgi:hypothetical protein
MEIELAAGLESSDLLAGKAKRGRKLCGSTELSLSCISLKAPWNIQSAGYSTT